MAWRDPYLDPDVDVLRNRVGLRDEASLRTFEYEQTALRLQALRLAPIDGRFDLAHLQAIHKHVFQDVYDWAGELRSVDISKGHDRFASHRLIAAAFAQSCAALAKEEQLRGLEKTAFVERLVDYYATWNAIHPFREGNGRATREFVAQLARGAGYEFDQARIDNAKGQWNAAARDSFHGRMAPLKAIMNDAIRPSRAIAFEQLSTEKAVARHPELAAAVAGLEALRDWAAARFADDPVKRDAAIAASRHDVQRRLDAGQVVQVDPVRARELVERSAKDAGQASRRDRGFER